MKKNNNTLTHAHFKALDNLLNILKLLSIIDEYKISYHLKMDIAAIKPNNHLGADPIFSYEWTIFYSVDRIILYDKDK
jgi:hypothetical protein